MKRILIITILITLAISQQVKDCLPAPLNIKPIKCSNKKSFVCGIRVIDGQQIKGTFINHCNACLNGMEFTVGGKCEDYPCNVWFCSPAQKLNKFCPLPIFMPYCGWYDNTIQCLVYPCSVDSDNVCNTCKIPHVLYATKGYCPSISDPNK